MDRRTQDATNHWEEERLNWSFTSRLNLLFVMALFMEERKLASWHEPMYAAPTPIRRKYKMVNWILISLYLRTSVCVIQSNPNVGYVISTKKHIGPRAKARWTSFRLMDRPKALGYVTA